MNGVYSWLGGRTTAFTLAYFVCGTVLAFMGKLTPVYAVSLGATLVTLLGKSVSDNYHDRQQKMLDAQAQSNVASRATGA